MIMTGIRLATLDDVTTLARFRVGLVHEERPGEPARGLFDECVTWFARELATRGFRAWIAMDAGEPVGTAGYRILDLLPRPGGAAFEARVHNVFVLEPFRGRGIGEALVRAALEEIAVQSFARVTLGPRERSRRFYERLGFEPGIDMRLPQKP